MKKISLFLCAMFISVTGAIAADGPCQVGPVNTKGKSKTADEFLYVSQVGGDGLECDRFFSGKYNSKCGNGKRARMPAGHWFNGEKISVAAVYECVARGGGDDEWVEVASCPKNYEMKDDNSCVIICPENYRMIDENSCEPIVGAKCNKDDLDFIGATDGVYKHRGEELGIRCKAIKCRNNTILWADSCWDPCSKEELEKKNATEGVEFFGTCYVTQCKDGYNKGNGGCIKKSDDNTKQETKDTDTQQSNAQKAKVGDACSEADLKGRNAAAGKYISNGNGGLSCMATECLSGAYRVYNKDDAYMGWCVFPSYCKNGTHLEIIDGTKTHLNCISDTDDKKIVVPDDDEFELPIDDDDDKNDNDNDVTDDDFARIKDTPVVRVPDSAAIIARIESANQEFESLTNGLKTKKWRNKDGKFNTARLASDGVAGVVLGTTAGLITAHVVKKGQIKNGFEDIKCTIGGQTVSDWGDELTVGVR